MEEDKEQKHICKFCCKMFPCGRSLGGHMRSHLITIPSSDHQKADQKLPKKKLPPLVNAKSSGKGDFSMEVGSGQFGHGLKDNNPKKTSCRFSKKSDTLLQEKLCKECGKSFQSWKALFGHMKCHSVNGKMTNNTVEEDSWNSSKLITDSQSDNEAATPSCRRKRSDRMKRYTAAVTNSSSLTNANFSSSISEIDHEQEQEEVALSLIILSRDKGDWGGVNSVIVEDSDHSFEVLEADEKIDKSLGKESKSDCLKFKKLRNGKLEPTILNSDELKSVKKLEFKTRELVSEKYSLDIDCNESEVNSPKNLISGNRFGQFGTESKKKNKTRKRKSIDAYAPTPDSELYQDFEKKSRFSCSICKRAFPSYQALGGHRASHKKFKGCCAPRSENSLDTENSHNQGENLIGAFSIERASNFEKEIGLLKRNKEHECPICFKVFASGQALGGHKRSHLIGDQVKNNNPSVETDQKPIRDIRNFLDLNLPAPDEEECSDFKPWWKNTQCIDSLILYRKLK